MQNSVLGTLYSLTILESVDAGQSPEFIFVMNENRLDGCSLFFGSYENLSVQADIIKSIYAKNDWSHCWDTLHSFAVCYKLKVLILIIIILLSSSPTNKKISRCKGIHCIVTCNVWGM